MKISATEVRSGDILHYKDELWKVTGLPKHTKPGKGPAYIQMVLRNISTRVKMQNRFKSSDILEKPYIEHLKLQFLYKEHNEFTFMNLDNFEQLSAGKSIVGDKEDFLFESTIISGSVFADKIVDITLPDTVEVEILDTEPYIKTATITDATKKAIIKPNVTICVPQYLKKGDKIIVKTSCGTFVKKAK